VAITKLAAGTVPYPSTGTSATFTLSLTGKGVQTGDVIVFFITTNSTVNTELSLPANATSLRSMNSIGVGVSCGVYWWQAPASVPSSVSFGWGTARRGDLAWVHLRGTGLVSNGFLASDWLAADSNNHPLPQVTTTAPNTFLLTGLALGAGSETPALPSGWTRETDAQEREGSIASRTQATAGLTPSGFWVSNSGVYQTQRWTLAVAEAATVPGPVEAELTSEPYPGFTGDVADGAAIVYDAANPGSSVVITTNKDTGGGLYVLGLDGQIMSSSLLGAANSVDWRDLTGVTGWDDRILVMTTDRQINALRYYWLNRTTKALTAAGTTSLAWEPYGTCLYVHSTGQVYAFVTQRGPDDTSPRNFYQYPLTRSGESVVAGAVARTVGTASVVEGLAADDATGYLFASEEDVGLFRYSASPSGGSARTTVDTVGGGNLVADVEDVAVARTSAGAWLLVSSQGDSSYHVYNLATLAHEQRFTIDRPGGDQVTSTDGLDVYLGDFGGSFPNGLIVVHDGDQTPISDFAFVDAGLVFGDLPDVVTGTLSGTLARITGATTGQVRVAGSMSGGPPKITGAATGAVRIAGTLTGLLPALTGSLTGDVLGVVSGSVAGTLPRLTGTATGTVAVPATLTAALPAITGTTSGGVTYTGTLTGTLPAIRGSITSADVVVGALAGTLPGITGAATGQQVIAGTIAAALPGVDGATAGQVRIGGTLTATLPRLTGAIAGTSESVAILGTLAAILPRLTGSIRETSPMEPELTIGRGPYGHPFHAGSPRGNPFTVSSPRR
jgi:3-phytase